MAFLQKITPIFWQGAICKKYALLTAHDTHVFGFFEKPGEKPICDLRCTCFASFMTG
jgi:hypothetical protein